MFRNGSWEGADESTRKERPKMKPWGTFILMGEEGRGGNTIKPYKLIHSKCSAVID